MKYTSELLKTHYLLTTYWVFIPWLTLLFIHSSLISFCSVQWLTGMSYVLKVIASKCCLPFSIASLAVSLGGKSMWESKIDPKVSRRWYWKETVHLHVSTNRWRVIWSTCVFKGNVNRNTIHNNNMKCVSGTVLLRY